MRRQFCTQMAERLTRHTLDEIALNSALNQLFCHHDAKSGRDDTVRAVMENKKTSSHRLPESKNG